TDADAGDLHTIAVTSDEVNVTVANLSGNVSGSTYDLVPTADWNGTANITVTVADDVTGLLSDTEVYTLTVTAINDAPVLTEIGDQATDEDNSLMGLSVTFSDADAGDLHTITISSDEVNVTVANLSGNISGSTYDLVPTANWNGTANITVTVTDDGTGLLSDTETYTLTVNDLNETFIDEVENKISFKLYPNPAIEELTIDLENPENKELQLEIYSYAGAAVYSEPIIHGKTVIISEFSAGLYFVRITGENMDKIWKVIFQEK
ncbi:MAG TPA: T9SS type A sorting domain-containing protein, partial [Bacteroides sp.]|nr:T9SS type A sorting domain-containing protein [Bacteroides sp.]